MAMKVQRVPAWRTATLRQHVLRPHQTVEEVAGSTDGGEGAVHFAAVNHEEVIGSASVWPERPPWVSGLRPSWRLRGMATAEVRRGQGVGTATLDAVVDHVRGQGGGLLWCHARTPAVRFYQRAGLVVQGEGWVDPVIGPHVAMEMVIAGGVERGK